MRYYFAITLSLMCMLAYTGGALNPTSTPTHKPATRIDAPHHAPPQPKASPPQPKASPPQPKSSSPQPNPPVKVADDEVKPITTFVVPEVDTDEMSNELDDHVDAGMLDLLDPPDDVVAGATTTPPPTPATTASDSSANEI